MRQRDKQAPQSAEETVREIRRATRRHFSAEEKIRIVLEGLRGEESIAELCRVIAERYLASTRGSPRTSTTDGPRSSSKPARSGSLAIPHARQAPMKLRGCVSRRVNSKKPWPKLLLRTGY